MKPYGCPGLNAPNGDPVTPHRDFCKFKYKGPRPGRPASGKPSGMRPSSSVRRPQASLEARESEPSQSETAAAVIPAPGDVSAGLGAPSRPDTRVESGMSAIVRYGDQESALRVAATQAPDTAQRAALLDQANRLTELREGMMACYMADRHEGESASAHLGVEHLYSRPVHVDDHAHVSTQSPHRRRAQPAPAHDGKSVSQCSACLMHTLHCVCDKLLPDPPAPESAGQDVFVDAVEVAALSAADVPVALPVPRMCHHQMEPQLLTVKDPASPNLGRRFYRCALPRSRQCVYFEWDPADVDPRSDRPATACSSASGASECVRVHRDAQPFLGSSAAVEAARWAQDEANFAHWTPARPGAVESIRG